MERAFELTVSTRFFSIQNEPIHLFSIQNESTHLFSTQNKPTRLFSSEKKNSELLKKICCQTKMQSSFDMDDSEILTRWAKDNRIQAEYQVLLNEGFDTIESVQDLCKDELVQFFDKFGSVKKILHALQKNPPTRESSKDVQIPTTSMTTPLTPPEENTGMDSFCLLLLSFNQKKRKTLSKLPFQMPSQNESLAS